MSDSLPDLPVHHQLSEFTQTHVRCRFFTIWATREPSLAQRLKCLPAMRETWVWSLGQKDPLEKEMATLSSILAWRIPWMREPGGLQSMGSQRVGHDWATSLSFFVPIEYVMPFNHLIFYHPLLLLPSIFPSIRVFSNEWVLHIKRPSIGVSSSASVLPMNTQDWSPSGLTGWISWQSKGLSRVFSNTTVQKHQFFSAQLSL